MLNDFDGGFIDIKYIVIDGKLTLDYSTGGSFRTCIESKRYVGLLTPGYIGITSGNPLTQNVNEVDVTSIDFYNMNNKFYQHQEQIVEGQDYYARDDNGYTGKTAYPYSAKLSTIEMGKVAFDVLEMKRTQREYRQEQQAKALNIIKREDDYREMIFKIFEQVRLMNEEMKNHLSIQDTKKQHIKQLETILMTEQDYQIFLDKIKEEDQRLYELSQKFADLTSEAKKILDEIKAKSNDRQKQHGVTGVDVKNHHRILPREIKEKLLDTAKEVSNLSIKTFKFIGRQLASIF